MTSHTNDHEIIEYYFDSVLQHFKVISQKATVQIDKINNSLFTQKSIKNTIRYLKHDYFVYGFGQDLFWKNEIKSNATFLPCKICGSEFAYFSSIESTISSTDSELYDKSFCNKCLSVKQYFNNFFTTEEYIQIFSSVIREKMRIFFDHRPLSRRKIISLLLNTATVQSSVVYQFKLLSIMPDYNVAGLESSMHLFDKAKVLEIMNQRRGIGGYKSIASNGVACSSLGERMIAEFLIDKQIIFEKEPLYPHHAAYNPNTAMRADFKVGNLWVELAGMMNLPEYAKKMENKKLLGRSLGLELLILQDYQDNDLQKIVLKLKKNHR